MGDRDTSTRARASDANGGTKAIKMAPRPPRGGRRGSADPGWSHPAGSPARAAPPGSPRAHRPRRAAPSPPPRPRARRPAHPSWPGPPRGTFGPGERRAAD
ncbi:hypothetical protein VULLAG_LOCUS4999 [Vulpes lagopus]